MLQPKQGYNEVLPRIVDIPTETLFHILRQLPRSDLLNILMSCRKFFRPAVYLLYRDVRLTNSTAMRFSVTILNRPSLYDAYCKYVTRLEFCSLSVVDAYTTFTILSQALSLCSELVDLRLYVQPSTVPFFARRLRDSLIILDDSKNDNEVGSPILHNNISLPRLRFLAVGGSVELVSICSFRFLSDLFLKFTMDSTTLLNMLEILRHSSSGGTLRNLTVKLMPSIDLEWAVRTISGVVGQLTGFCVFKPLTTITAVVGVLESIPEIFPCIEAIFINPRNSMTILYTTDGRADKYMTALNQGNSQPDTLSWVIVGPLLFGRDLDQSMSWRVLPHRAMSAWWRSINNRSQYAYLNRPIENFGESVS